MAGQLAATCFVPTSRRVGGKFDRSDIDDVGGGEQQGLLWLSTGSSRFFMQTARGHHMGWENFSTTGRLTSTDQRDICQGCRIEQVGKGRRQVRRVVAPFETILLLIHFDD